VVSRQLDDLDAVLESDALATFGNWFSPFRQVFAAAVTSLNTINLAQPGEGVFVGVWRRRITVA
jgi:hypothetical protein